MNRGEVGRRREPVARTGQSRDAMIEAWERLAKAEELRQAGKHSKALSICDGLLARYPDYVGALQTAGLASADSRQNQRALNYLSRAVMLCPDNWGALMGLSSVYLELGAHQVAARTLQQAIKLAPEDLGVRAMLGMIYHEDREYERAAEVYREVFARDGTFTAAAIGLAMACTALGQYAEAVSALARLVARGERSVRILLMLSRIPAGFLELDLAELVGAAAPTPLDAPGEFERSLAYLRARIEANAGNHAEAWRHLIEANRLSLATRQEERRNTARRQAALLDRLRSLPPAGALRPVSDNSRPVSLFIFGPSRAGKTSLERLVGGLDGVKRGYESPLAENAIRKTFQLAGFLASGSYLQLPPGLDSALRGHYLAELAQRAGTARVFTNTDPTRISDAVRMASVIPNCRFLFVARDPQDTALRIFMQDYRFGNAYAYDMKSIFEHLAWYDEMTEQVSARLPDISTTIQYDDMIEDPASALRVVADLCGLPVPDAPLPALGDDRGCAGPYREFIRQALQIQP